MQLIRIGVLSDTHVPKAALDLPEAVCREFKKVDMILHAGDLIERSVLDKLEHLAPTHAVYGNMDMHDLKACLPQKDVIKINGFRIGLMHGYGPPTKLIDAVRGEFTRVDAIVFGHSHVTVNEVIGKTLFFNPGTPTDKVFAAFNSFGILEIGESIKGTIIRIS